MDNNITPSAPAFGNPSRPMSDDGSSETRALPESNQQPDVSFTADRVNDPFEPRIQEIIDSFQENENRTLIVDQDGVRRIVDYVKNKTKKILKKGTILYALNNLEKNETINGNFFSFYDAKGVFFTSIRDIAARRIEPYPFEDELIIDKYILTTDIVVQTNFMQDKYIQGDIIYTEMLLSLNYSDASFLTSLFLEYNNIDIAYALFGLDFDDLRSRLISQGGSENMQQILENSDTTFLDKYAGKFNRYVTMSPASAGNRLLHTDTTPELEQGAAIYLTNVNSDSKNGGIRTSEAIKFVGRSTINSLSLDYIELYIYLKNLYTLEDLNKAYSFDQHEYLRFTLFESRKTIISVFEKIRDEIKWVKKQPTHKIGGAFWINKYAENYYVGLIERVLDFLYIKDDPITDELSIVNLAYQTIYNPNVILAEGRNWSVNNPIRTMEGYENWNSAFPKNNIAEISDIDSKRYCNAVLSKINEKIQKLEALESVDTYYNLYHKNTWNENDMKKFTLYFSQDFELLYPQRNYLYFLPSNYVKKQKTLFGPGPTSISDNGEFIKDNNVDYSLYTLDHYFAEMAWDLYGNNSENRQILKMNSNNQRPITAYLPAYVTSSRDSTGQKYWCSNIFNANFKITHNFNSIYKNKKEFLLDKYPCSPGTKMCNQLVLCNDETNNRYIEIYLLGKESIPVDSISVQDFSSYEEQDDTSLWPVWPDGVWAKLEFLPSGEELNDMLQNVSTHGDYNYSDRIGMLLLAVDYAIRNPISSWPAAVIASVASVSAHYLDDPIDTDIILKHAIDRFQGTPGANYDFEHEFTKFDKSLSFLLYPENFQHTFGEAEETKEETEQEEEKDETEQEEEKDESVSGLIENQNFDSPDYSFDGEMIQSPEPHSFLELTDYEDHSDATDSRSRNSPTLSPSLNKSKTNIEYNKMPKITVEIRKIIEYLAFEYFWPIKFSENEITYIVNQYVKDKVFCVSQIRDIVKKFRKHSTKDMNPARPLKRATRSAIRTLAYKYLLKSGVIKRFERQNPSLPKRKSPKKSKRKSPKKSKRKSKRKSPKKSKRKSVKKLKRKSPKKSKRKSVKKPQRKSKR